MASPLLNPLLGWLLASTGLLGAWWGCYRLALRPERSFGYNRAFLVAGPLLAVFLPLLPLAWPAAWGAGLGLGWLEGWPGSWLGHWLGSGQCPALQHRRMRCAVLGGTHGTARPGKS